MRGGRVLETLHLIGGRPLKGTLPVQGAKNAVLPILAAAAAVPGEITLTNCPFIRDVEVTLDLLEGLGAAWSRRGDRLTLNGAAIRPDFPDPGLAGRLRSSVLLLGALLGRFGRAEIPLPGGCVLGARPLDLHCAGLEQLGVRVSCGEGRLRCEGRPKAGRVVLPYPSVGATENLMLAALGAEGPVELLGAAREPEIRDLGTFLNRCGARITAAGTGRLEIRPGPLHGGVHRIMPDRMEAATWLCAAAATGGCLRLTRCCPAHLEPVLEVLSRAGCEITRGPDWIRLQAGPLRAAGAVTTGPYPGFPTDAQAPVMGVMTLGEGITVFRETVFENRFRHVPGLRALGARIDTRGEIARVRGVPRLRGARLEATDLRGAAALTVAALAAEGESELSQAWHLDRGYGAFVQKLKSLGAEVEGDD